MTQGSRIAIDVGGTFTDVVTLDSKSNSPKFDKVPTTPSDPRQGVMSGFEASEVDISDLTAFIHGTTLGLNALLTRRGAKTGIITTRGFRDVYLLGRTDRIPMYDFKYKKPETLVRRRDIFEVDERMNFEGEILQPFDESSAVIAAQAIRDSGMQSVAVCFLHSYVNPEHEIRMGEILSTHAPDVEVTLSSNLSREMREYERTSTAVLDAYTKPIIRKYVSNLQSSLAEKDFQGQFLMTRSGGGAMTAESAKTSPVNLILSGPAGGVLGAAWFSKVSGFPNLITIDMGGTSLDASLVVDQEPLTYFDASFEGLPINLSSLYIHTIGAGGGSLVWIDEGNHLQVGPASAGADPGPAAYGNGGTEATFTDAALHVGYLGNDFALAGSLELNSELATAAIKVSADAMNMSVDDVARGVIRIAVTKIVGAVRAITVELGHNPSDFALLSFGGGGGLVGVDVARELNIPTVIVPPGPGAFSAFGMLMADVQHDYARTRIGMLEQMDISTVENDLAEMQDEARSTLSTEGFENSNCEFNAFLDLRYVGQEHSVTLPIAFRLDAEEKQRLTSEFSQLHEKAYGHVMPDPIELVTVRLSAVGRVERPQLEPMAKGTSTPVKSIGRRSVITESGGVVNYAVYHRDDMQFGQSIQGPSIIAEHTSTTVLHEGDAAKVGSFGELVVTIGGVE